MKSHRARAQVALAIATAVALIFGIQGIASALPAIQRELDLADSELALLTAAYVLPGVVLAVPLGYAADALGRRRVFIAMALLFGAAGGAQAFVDALGPLLALRFLQGIGFASLMPMTITIIGDALDGLAQVRAQSQRQFGVQVAELTVPLAGAGLAALAWNAPFVVQAVVVALAPLGVLLAPRVERDRTVTYVSGLGAAVLRPGIPELLGAGFVRFWCKFALVAYLPVLLVHDRGASLLQAAAVVSVASLCAAAVSPWVGRLVRRRRPSRLVMASAVLLAAGLAGLGVAPSWQVALVPAVVVGVGDGVLSVLQNSLLGAAAPPGVRAGLMSAASMARNSGKLLAPLVMGAAMLAVPAGAAFVAMGVAAGLSVGALRRVALLDGILARDPPWPQAQPLGSKIHDESL